MSNISDLITITSKNNYICYKCDTGGLMTREVEFGSFNDSDDSDDSDNETKTLSQSLNESFAQYIKTFRSQQQIHVYTKKECLCCIN